MKHKLRKFLFVLFISFSFIFNINAQVEIKEDSNNYNGDVYIIGSSRFDNNIIITGTMASRAGAREAMVQYFVYDNYDYDVDELKIYYLSGLDKTWYVLPAKSGEEFRELTESEEEELVILTLFFANI